MTNRVYEENSGTVYPEITLHDPLKYCCPMTFWHVIVKYIWGEALFHTVIQKIILTHLLKYSTAIAAVELINDYSYTIKYLIKLNSLISLLSLNSTNHV